MKIFLAFLQSRKKHPIPAYSFWEYYIKSGIEESGNQWVEAPETDWAEGLVPKSELEQNRWRDLVWERTLASINKERPDIFLSYLYPSQVEKSALQQIKKWGIPCVNFFCDNIREFKTAPTEFEVFDLNWVPEYKALNMYKRAGYSYCNLPMPMFVAPRYRQPANDSLAKITFIGSHDLLRQNLLEEVLDIIPQLPLEIFGRGWNKDNEASFTPAHPSSLASKFQNNMSFLNRQGLRALIRKFTRRNMHRQLSERLQSCVNGNIEFNEYIRLTRESFITLGINRYPSFRHSLRNPDTYSRLRDIEAPMLGACYLTEYTDGIAEFYDLENEIRTYKSGDELIACADRLLKDQVLRRKLKASGQKKALENLSIPATIKHISNYFHLE